MKIPGISFVPFSLATFLTQGTHGPSAEVLLLKLFIFILWVLETICDVIHLKKFPHLYVVKMDSLICVSMK